MRPGVCAHGACCWTHLKKNRNGYFCRNFEKGICRYIAPEDHPGRAPTELFAGGSKEEEKWKYIACYHVSLSLRGENWCTGTECEQARERHQIEMRRGATGDTIVIGGKELAAPGLEQPGPPQEAPPAPPQPPVAASVATGSRPELRDDSQGNDVGQGFGDEGKRQPPAHPEPLLTASEVIGKLSELCELVQVMKQEIQILGPEVELVEMQRSLERVQDLLRQG